MTRQILIELIQHLMTLKRMGFSEQFIELELQECKQISLKKLYRRYIVIYNRFCEKYPDCV